MNTCFALPARNLFLIGIVLLASLFLSTARSSDALAGTWDTPVAVTSGNAVVWGKAFTAVDSSGNVTAVWSELRSGYYGVYASRYSGSSWSTPVLISAAGSDATQAAVVVDSTGVVTAMWNVTSGSNNIITAARYSSGSWSSPVAVSGSDRNAYDAYPQMAVDSSGVITAVWSQNLNAGYVFPVVIKASRYSSGAWSAPVQLSQSNCNAQYPQVSTSGVGTAVAVWTGCDSTFSSNRVQSAQFASGTWGASTTFEPSGGSGIFETAARITADGAGVITAMWSRYSYSTSKYRMIVSRLVAGSWSAPAEITGDLGGAGDPRLAADALGNVTAIWLQLDATNSKYLVGATRYSGSSWSTPEIISPVTGSGANYNSATYPGTSLVVGSSGVAVAAWSRSDGTNDRIQVARFESGSWGSAQNISSTGQNARQTTLAIDSAGTVTAVWGKLLACMMGCSFNGASAARYVDTAPPVNCGTSGTFTVTANHIVSSSSCVGTVTVPSTVTDIDASAFSGAAITGVTFTEPSSLTTIGEYAFLNTTSLGSITLPNSVTTIGQSAFNGSHVANVTLPSNVSFTTIPTGMFANASSLTSITIPTNVTTINMDAFNAASSLASVTFASPSGVTSIGDRVFVDATSLTSITIPNSVTTIGSTTFAGTGLRSITIPNSVTTIGDRVFYGASSLTSVILPTNSSFTSMGSNTFQYATSLRSITIPSSVTSIGSSTFAAASSLTSITIPNSVTSIGSYAFQGVSGLTKLTIPSGVTTVGDSAFSNMTALTRIEFLGNQPSCSGFRGAACTSILDSSTNATVYRFANATSWPDITSTYQGRPQAYFLLPPAAPTVVAGDASVTITATAPSAGPTPDTYTVATVGDSTKTCTITAPATSCLITGLTNGTSYSFTAIANTTTPAVSSLASAASNAVTPTVASSGTTTETGTTTPTTTPDPTSASSTPLPMTSKAKVTNNAIVTTFTAPGSGSVRHVGTIPSGRRGMRASTITVCTYNQTITAAGITQVTCNLNNAGRRLRTQQPLVITLTTTFTPTSGTPMVSTKNVRLASTPIVKAPTKTSTKPSSVTG